MKPRNTARRPEKGQRRAALVKPNCYKRQVLNFTESVFCKQNDLCKVNIKVKLYYCIIIIIFTSYLNDFNVYNWLKLRRAIVLFLFCTCIDLVIEIFFHTFLIVNLYMIYLIVFQMHSENKISIIFFYLIVLSY